MQKPTVVGLDQIAAAAAQSVDLAAAERTTLSALYQPFEPTMGMFPTEPDPIFSGI